MNNKEFDKLMKTNLTNILDELGADSERKSYQMTGPAPPSLVDSVTRELIIEHKASADDIHCMIKWLKIDNHKNKIDYYGQYLSVIYDNIEKESKSNTITSYFKERSLKQLVKYIHNKINYWRAQKSTVANELLILRREMRKKERRENRHNYRKDKVVFVPFKPFSIFRK